MAPAVSRLGRALMTQVIAEGLAVCLKMMRLTFRPKLPREVSSCGLCGCNTVLRDVVGVAAFGIARNFDRGSAPHLCVSLMGATRRLMNCTVAFRPTPALTPRGRKVCGAPNVAY